MTDAHLLLSAVVWAVAALAVAVFVWLVVTM